MRLVWSARKPFSKTTWCQADPRTQLVKLGRWTSKSSRLACSSKILWLLILAFIRWASLPQIFETYSCCRDDMESRLSESWFKASLKAAIYPSTRSVKLNEYVMVKGNCLRYSTSRDWAYMTFVHMLSLCIGFSTSLVKLIALLILWNVRALQMILWCLILMTSLMTTRSTLKASSVTIWALLQALDSKNWFAFSIQTIV